MVIAPLFALVVLLAPANGPSLEEIDERQTLEANAASATAANEETRARERFDVTWKVATASTVATLACAGLAFLPLGEPLTIALVFGIVPPVLSSLLAGVVASLVGAQHQLGLKVGLGGLGGALGAALLVFVPTYALGTAWDAPYRGTDVVSGWATSLPMITVPEAAIVGAIAGATVAAFVVASEEEDNETSAQPRGTY